VTPTDFVTDVLLHRIGRNRGIRVQSTRSAANARSIVQ
jgi:hypothetical protein